MRADPGSSALGVVQADLAGVCRALMNVVTGARGKTLIDDLRTTVGGTPSEIVWQALYADCLRVVHSAVMADGVIEDREIEALYDIIVAAARQYAAGLRSQYGELSVVDRESARAFLDRYAADRGPFGRGARLRWLGLILCRRAAELGEHEALQRYTKAMTSMTAEARRLAGAPSPDPRRRASTDELDDLQRILAREATATVQGVDRRIEAFLAPCSVFTAVQQASSMYENNPFDVEAVHREARVTFEKLVAQATMRPQPPDLGRMLVVLGDSGAGKTHLLRGFRRHVHDGQRGFVVYAQLQSRSEDYSRYLLFHLVESLTRLYSEQSGRTGLRELAGGLLRLAGPGLRKRIEALADDNWEGSGSLAEHVDELVTDLLAIRELGRFDLDLLRVLVYALLPDPKTTSCVRRYLHCEPMSDRDRAVIGNVMPRTRDDDPHWMILDLARFAAVTQRALVIMVDQVDLAGFDADSTKIFRRAIDALYKVVSECSSAVAVIACLSDLYSAARSELNRPAIDRLENSPPIARLQVNRSYAEIEAVVARRLSIMFAEHGTVHRPEQPVYPIPESELRQQENRRLRDVLEWCHQFQAQCAAAGKIIHADEPVHVEVKPRELDLDTIAAEWSEATLVTNLEIPDDGLQILDAVAKSAKAYAHEMGLALVAVQQKRGLLRLRMSRGEDGAALAICVANQGYQGGAFTGQIESLRKRARGMVPIAVRTLEFPRGRACDKAIGQLITAGGRGVYLDASALRALIAFQRFQPSFPADRVSAWQLRDRPISSLPAVAELFDFERSRVELPLVRASDSSPAGHATEMTEPLLDGVDTEPADDTLSRDPAGAASPEPMGSAPFPAPTRSTGELEAMRGAALPERMASSATHDRMRGVAPLDPVGRVAPEIVPGAEAPAPKRRVTQRDPLRDKASEPTPGPGALGRTRGATPPSSSPPSLPPPPPPPVAEKRAPDSSHKASDRESTPNASAKHDAAGDAATARVTNGLHVHGPTEPAIGWPSAGPEPSEGAKARPSSLERSVPRPDSVPAKQLWIGNSTSFEAEPITLELASLLGHVAIVDSAGSGRIAAALNIVEHALERCVPAIVLDRTGEMSGYARPDWWQRSAEPARARALAKRIDVRLFTPGMRYGRPLAVPIVPDLSRVPHEDHERAVRLAAGTVAPAIAAATAAEPERLALLTQAIAVLAKRSSSSGLVELIALLDTGHGELGGTSGDEQLRQGLVEDLSALLSNADVFMPGAEPLASATLIGPTSGGRVPLAIIYTGFLGDGPRLQSWVSQLIGSLSRELASRTCKTLQTLFVLDGAELFLPGGASKASSKEPLQELVKRAAAAGLGLVLASQQPADLDYRRCTAVDTWFVGKTDTEMLEKMKALFKHRPLGHRNPSRLESGRFVMLHEGGARDVERAAPLLRIEQVDAPELKSLAARTRPRSADASLVRRAEAASEDRELSRIPVPPRTR